MSTEHERAKARAIASLADMTREADSRIDVGIAQDPDNPELMDEDFARMQPHHEVEAELARRSLRGPQKAPTKKLISLRLDREVIERFRALGPGWQARINEVLRKAAGL
jgi:uncharacterized protein (DUF4415 family)